MDNFDYTVTEIQVKSDKKQLGDMIKNDLKDYVSSPKITILDDKEASDLVLIFATIIGLVRNAFNHNRIIKIMILLNTTVVW